MGVAQAGSRGMHTWQGRRHDAFKDVSVPCAGGWSVVPQGHSARMHTHRNVRHTDVNLGVVVCCSEGVMGRELVRVNGIRPGCWAGKQASGVSLPGTYDVGLN